MDKTLFFVIIAMVCLWLILDEFYGGKRVSMFVESVLNM